MAQHWYMTLHLKLCHSRWLSISFGMSLMLLIILIQLLTANHLSFEPFYLLPIGLVTWYAGQRWGLVISLVNSLSLMLIEWLMQTSTSLVSTIWNWSTQTLLGLVLVYGLTRFRRVLESERRLARLDSLTNLLNRRAFDEVLQREFYRAQRYKRPLTVVSIDCDGFKAINDLLGHQTGDAVLAEVGRTMSRTIRATDVAARLGGDEFTLVFPETDFPAASVSIQRLLRALHRAMDHHHWPVTFSIGAIIFHSLPISSEAMLVQADRLMYHAKRTGKNQALLQLVDGSLSPTVPMQVTVRGTLEQVS